MDDNEKLRIRNLVAKLRKLAEDRGDKLRIDYSGRAMYGKRCAGIDTDDANDVIAAAGALGIRGAKTDQMGIGMIVYYPAIDTTDLQKELEEDEENGYEADEEDEEDYEITYVVTMKISKSTIEEARSDLDLNDTATEERVVSKLLEDYLEDIDESVEIMHVEEKSREVF